MARNKVAVVTGSNKGIGFAIVKGLCEKFEGLVYLTARNVKAGEEAVAKLKALGYNTSFHQLDITDQDSVNKFRDHLKETHGKIDVLVNNAGMMVNVADQTEDNVQRTIDVNYFGTLRVCQALFPLLNTSAKVINVSSSAGHLFRIPSAELQEKFKDSQLTIEKLSRLMKEFLEDYKSRQIEQKGWPKSAYTVSKVGVSALSIVQQRNFDIQSPDKNIMVNFVHPGWILTDLNSRGTMTTETGARSTLYLIFDVNLKGKYVWWDCQIIDWYSPNLPPRPYPIQYRRK